MSYGYVSPSTGFTVECWFKSDAVSAQYRTLWNSRTQGSVTWNLGTPLTATGRQFTMGIAQTTNALGFTIANEGNTTATTVATWADPSPSGYANDNQWHFVAFRLSSNQATWTMFLDGAVLGTANTSAPVTWKPSLQTFGAEYGPQVGDFGSNLWDKWLAYPAMFEKALSDNRILEHYTAGSGGTVYYGDSEVTRLHRISDWADLPAQSREFDAALINLQGIQVVGTNALTAMQDTAAAASGNVFADGQSRLVYHNRRHSYNRWVATTLAESLGAAPEVGLTFTVDDTHIFNDIRGDRPYGSQVRVVDDFSKAAYGRKVYSFSIAVTTHEELRNAVAWLANKYREPAVRVSSVSFRAESSDLIEWAATGGLTVGDHIVLDELPGDAAPEASMDFIVEKVAIDVDVLDRVWKLDLELSPYSFQDVFQIGVSTLGSVHRVAY